MERAIPLPLRWVVVIAVLSTAAAHAADLQPNSDLTVQGQGLDFAVGGVGLLDLGLGTSTITVNIGGPVERAILYWAGRDFPCPRLLGTCVVTEPYQDQQLIFNGTPILGTLIGTEMNLLSGGSMNNIGYRADVTEIVRAAGGGVRSFSLQDGDLANNFSNAFSGASLVVVYRDLADPTVYQLMGFDGLDAAWAGATLPEAHVATPVTFSYSPAAAVRSAELAIFVGGAEATRPDRIDISDNPGFTNQLGASSRLGFDADVFAIDIPMGVGSTTVEVVSPAGTIRSDSLLWGFALLRLPLVQECVPNTPCDDGNACTKDDWCDAGGDCAGTPIDCGAKRAGETASCDPLRGCVSANLEGDNVAGRPDTTPHPQSGNALSAHPDLCLATSVAALGEGLGAVSCGIEEGGTVTVEVNLSPSTESICAAQFFLEYDADALSFRRIIAGGGVFNTALFEFVDQSVGTIDYVIGENPGSICNGNGGEAGTIATIVFDAIGTCENAGVRFRPHVPPTRLGSTEGLEVCPAGHFSTSGQCGDLVTPCNTGSLRIDSTAPVMTCPDIVTEGHADCGVATRHVTWDPITAVDGCDGPLPVTCSISNDLSRPVAHLVNGGGDFPAGTTTITCRSEPDTCGNVAECQFQVSNTGFNVIRANIELSPTLAGTQFVRGIDFVISECAGNELSRTFNTCVDVSFGDPTMPPGQGRAEFQVPTGRFQCLEATDTLHSLRSTCGLVCQDIPGEGSVWIADFGGSPTGDSSCHWLINGNLSGLDDGGVGRIDIRDYVAYVLAIIIEPLPPVDSPCGTTVRHADINGDGLVNLLDFSFVLINMFNEDAAGCDAFCSLGVTGPASTEFRTSMTMRELSDLGLGRAARLADMNDDGVVDMTDVAIYFDASSESSVSSSRTKRHQRAVDRGIRSVRDR